MGFRNSVIDSGSSSGNSLNSIFPLGKRFTTPVEGKGRARYSGNKFLLVKLIEIIELTRDLSGRDLGSIKVFVSRGSAQSLLLLRAARWLSGKLINPVEVVEGGKFVIPSANLCRTRRLVRLLAPLS